MKVWMNGRLVDKDKACISVFDHGLLYGDGVFEGIRVYGGRIFQCAAHVDRLYESAKSIRLTIPLTKQEVTEAMAETVRANALGDAYIRLVVTRGPGNLGLNPMLCAKATVFVIADQIKMYPAHMYENGMAVIVARTHRTSSAMLPPRIKSLNYLNNILAKIEGLDAGVSEVVMLNAAGNVAEASGDNIFIVQGGAVLTPPPEADILIGVTRQVVIDLCGKLGLPLRQENVSVAQLYAADECFLTGTAAEVIAVTKVDDRAIGTGRPGPITTRLLAAFRALTRPGT